jgi:hypothetical protein
MQVSIDRLKTLLIKRNEPEQKVLIVYEKNGPIEKPVMKTLVPIIFRSRSLAIGACSEKLYFDFCDYCQNPYHKAELIAVKGNVCLMSCNRTGCSKLFRIDTA